MFVIFIVAFVSGGFNNLVHRNFPLRGGTFGNIFMGCVLPNSVKIFPSWGLVAPTLSWSRQTTCAFPGQHPPLTPTHHSSQTSWIAMQYWLLDILHDQVGFRYWCHQLLCKHQNTRAEIAASSFSSGDRWKVRRGRKPRRKKSRSRKSWKCQIPGYEQIGCALHSVQTDFIGFESVLREDKPLL